MPIKLPIAKIKPKLETLPGDTRTDNYIWLCEKSNPEVITYLESKNEYLTRTRPLCFQAGTKEGIIAKILAQCTRISLVRA